MDRRKIIEESITTDEMKEQIDWDRLLWLPGEKKIFLPSITSVSLYSLWGEWDDKLAAIAKEMRDKIQTDINRMILSGRQERYEGMCDECQFGYLDVSREYIAQPRVQPVYKTREQEREEMRMERNSRKYGWW